MDTSDAKIKELEKKLLEEEDTVEDVDRAHYILEIGKIYKERALQRLNPSTQKSKLILKFFT